MSLFVCDECDSVENTALAGYRGWHGRNIDLHTDQIEDHPEWVETGLGDGKARCSACNPEVGGWHGLFAREKHDGSREVVNR